MRTEKNMRSAVMARSREIGTLSIAAREAARAGDWSTVRRHAKQILKRNPDSSEGHFLLGQAAKAAGRLDDAEKHLLRCLQNDGSRYDAAIELAALHVGLLRNQRALELLEAYEERLGNSPLYLEMAASTYTRLDLHEKALPLLRLACDLQPEIERFRVALASCCVYLGKIDEARRIYEELLEHHPNHRRFHYELAQLGTAPDSRHVDQMKSVLARTGSPPVENIFLYYALGKELEDLGEWDEAFEYYKLGGDAAKRTSPYDISSDIELIDAIIEACGKSWLQDGVSTDPSTTGYATPVFVVGLPRTGTTLIERIISSHSLVSSVGETFFLQHAVRAASGIGANVLLNADIIRAAAAAEAREIVVPYLDAISYKLGGEPMFVEKLPENFLLIGFIARSFPEHSIVHVKRKPMDACFAMYKQSYFRYAYTLKDLGHYYVAYHRLMEHWRSLLGDGLIEVSYETLVSEPEGQIRELLARLALPFEEACLQFEKSHASTRTASAVQVREKMHTRSVNRWRHFERQLAPLRDYLVAHGIEVV